jgi:hypothetical protein
MLRISRFILSVLILSVSTSSFAYPVKLNKLKLKSILLEVYQIDDKEILKICLDGYAWFYSDSQLLMGPSIKDGEYEQCTLPETKPSPAPDQGNN